MTKGKKKSIEQYEHADKPRKNNPPVSHGTPENDRDTEAKTSTYDPHLDPQLMWARKTEHTSFEVPTPYTCFKSPWPSDAPLSSSSVDSELIGRRHSIKESSKPPLVDREYELEEVLLRCGVL